ncbi:GRF1-interacting factor 1-like protein [Tanacetum coccineum]|uniref:GRF1-interacting factor 1-like protein n=1 Tax=Tanacetum coccineum TaxID=301880 RepID=A0ABQ5AUC1_9ASTR
MRGFMWCQGDIRRGKAKVAWEVVFLPKKEGGLWLHSLDIFNKALMDVPIRGNMTWGWRKVLQIRPIIQELIWYRIGDGSKVSVWFDHWCPISPLSKIISACDIHKAGFDMSNMIKDLFNNGQWTWPHDWISKYPAFATIVVPNIVYNDVDEGDEITWYDVVWFLNCIPRHAFHLWLVIKRKLKTQDNLRQWEVWNHMKIYAGTPRVAASLNAIIDHIIPISKKKTTRSMIGLSFADSVARRSILVGVLGFLVFELEMQEVLSQQVEALKTYMDCHVSKATQEVYEEEAYATKKPNSRVFGATLENALIRVFDVVNITMGAKDVLKHVVGVPVNLAFQVIANFRLYSGGVLASDNYGSDPMVKFFLTHLLL